MFSLQGYRVAITTALIVLLFMSPLAVALAADSHDIAERPDPAGTPTIVTVGLHVFDVDRVNDVSQQFAVDMFLYVSWHDQRLAVPPEQRTGRLRSLALNSIWTPRGLVINDRGLAPQLPKVAEVDDAGMVTLQQRLIGNLSADMRLQDFPFDNQVLPITFISYHYSPAEVQFAEQVNFTGDPHSFSADGWALRQLAPVRGIYTIPELGVERVRMDFLFAAVRDKNYYLSTMFLPMALIAFMAWIVFWLQPDLVAPRVAIANAAVFSLIAFGFSIRLSLPKISYMTRADVYALGCMLLVFMALAVAVIGSRLAVAERMEQALKLNAFARWAYVGLFVVLMLYSYYS